MMIAISLALGELGHSVQAADIMLGFVRSSKLKRHPEVSVRIAACLARANRMAEALAVAEEFFSDETTMDTAQIYLLPFLSSSRSLPGPVVDFGVRVLSRCRAETERRGDAVQAGTLAYNTGNLLRSMGRFREGVREYRVAASLHPEYARRSYYWRELAGMLFGACRYKMAAQLYKASLELQEDRLTACLHADALLFSGQYEVAAKCFEQALKPPYGTRDFEWLLKQQLIDWIRQVVAAGSQRRQSYDFPAGFPEEMSPPQIEDTCKRALHQDALSALAWFNLGAGHQQREDTDSAASCFLATALVQPLDTEAWGNVIAYALNEDDSVLLAMALSEAYRHNGENMLRDIAQRVPERQDELVKLLTELVDGMRAETDDVLTVRTPTGPDTWHEESIGV
ncbi:hypothetical protein ACFL6X_06485 [Candidatus Latescibacterota bacterium]